jgi:hypothetical protein
VTVLRALVAVIAALLIAWFAVMLRDERIGSHASSRIFDHPNLNDAEWRRNMDRLRQAGLLNPDRHWAVTRAALLLPRDPRRAAREAESVLRREPENIGAWGIVLRATEGRDPKKAARAAAAIRRLDPLGSQL